MRKLIIVASVAGLMGLGGTALASGPNGSSESGNEVTCGTDGVNVPTPVGTVNAGPTPSGGTSGGIEVCSDDGAVIQGRIIAAGSAGTGGADGYLAADGDASNTPDQADGYIRADNDGAGGTPRVICGDEGGSLNSESPGAADTTAECVPNS